MLIAQRSKDGDPDFVHQGITEEILSRIGFGELWKWAVPNDVFDVDQLSKTREGKLGKKVVRLDFLTRSDIKA